MLKYTVLLLLILPVTVSGQIINSQNRTIVQNNFYRQPVYIPPYYYSQYYKSLIIQQQYYDWLYYNRYRNYPQNVTHYYPYWYSYPYVKR